MPRTLATSPLAAFTGGVLIWGGKGSKDAKLPITRGPQKAAVSTSAFASTQKCCGSSVHKCWLHLPYLLTHEHFASHGSPVTPSLHTVQFCSLTGPTHSV